MSKSSKKPQAELENFEIIFVGKLQFRWLIWFDGFELVTLETGETLLRGQVRDQSELYGILEKIHSLNLKLRSVKQLPGSSSNSELS